MSGRDLGICLRGHGRDVERRRSSDQGAYGNCHGKRLRSTPRWIFRARGLLARIQAVDGNESAHVRLVQCVNRLTRGTDDTDIAARVTSGRANPSQGMTFGAVRSTLTSSRDALPADRNTRCVVTR